MSPSFKMDKIYFKDEARKLLFGTLKYRNKIIKRAKEAGELKIQKVALKVVIDLYKIPKDGIVIIKHHGIDKEFRVIYAQLKKSSYHEVQKNKKFSLEDNIILSLLPTDNSEWITLTLTEFMEKRHECK